MSSRPYQHYSEGELLDIRRANEGHVRRFRQEETRQGKIAGWDHESVREIQFKLRNCSEIIAAVNDELAVRRAERGRRV